MDRFALRDETLGTIVQEIGSMHFRKLEEKGIQADMQ
jgi:hypothetical protein